MTTMSFISMRFLPAPDSLLLRRGKAGIQPDGYDPDFPKALTRINMPLHHFAFVTLESQLYI